MPMRHGEKSLMLIENLALEKLKLLAQQGYSNEIYLFEHSSKKYLLRKFKIDLDRKLEFQIQKKAFAKNIAAKPILLDEKKGLMVVEYLAGEHKTKLTQQELKKIAQLLIKLHKIKTRKKQNSFKEHFSFKNKKVKKAFSILDKETKEYALGHNDLHARNIIFYKTSIKLIDWEYARYSDIYFDLVSIMIEYKLNTKDSNTFLRSYFGRKKINRKKLKAFTIIYKALWTLWFEKLAKGEL